MLVYMHAGGGIFDLHSAPSLDQLFLLSLDVRCIRPCMAKVWKLQIWGDAKKLDDAYQYVLEVIQANGPPIGWTGSTAFKFLSPEECKRSPN